MDEAELIKLLLETFKLEANEHINIIAKGLIDFEKDTDEVKRKNILEEIYRSAHSMKGASRAVNLSQIEKICQSLESCFSLMKKGELDPSPHVYDIFHSVINTIEMLLDEDDEEKPGPEIINKYVDLLNNIQNYQSNTNQKSVSKDPEIENTPLEEKPIVFNEQKEESIDFSKNQTKQSEEDALEIQEEESLNTNEEQLKPERSKSKSSTNTIRLSTKKVDTIYLNAEESLQIKLSHNQEVNQIKEISKDLSSMSKQWAIVYAEIMKIQQNKETSKALQNVIKGGVSFSAYENINESFKSVHKKFSQLIDTSRYVTNTTQNILDTLVDEVKHLLMLPFSDLLSGFPRIVRELSKDMHKEVELEMTGTNIEVDRRIMEGLKDPLVHMIRNSIDHGIEKPEIRKNAGKSEIGKILISITQIDSNHVRIKIKDDGIGIDNNKLINKAIKSRVLTKEESTKLSEGEASKLIFKSGLSTSSIITDISGRGLGLSIVEENVEKLGGKVSVKSIPGQECIFTIEIPTTISKSQGLLVAIDEKKFIIPVSNIVETIRIKKETLKKVENKDTIQYQGNTLPLIKLADVLQINAEEKSSQKFIHLVIIESKNQRIGFIVNDIISEQEVLFKKLGYPLFKVRNISGVSLLGSGEICPILNNQDLVKTAQQTSASSISSSGKKAKGVSVQKSILIAEDSITSRLFIKNILEGAGYKVKATVDGREAFTALKQEKFDMLVSDIEMPRMTGFELTEAVRKDKALEDLPVVLVSSLSKREDQEKGIDVGANAYIVKSSFEQSNLLEVIKRLI